MQINWKKITTDLEKRNMLMIQFDKEMEFYDLLNKLQKEQIMLEKNHANSAELRILENFWETLEDHYSPKSNNTMLWQIEVFEYVDLIKKILQYDPYTNKKIS